MGKIKTEEDKKKNSLYPVAERLREYLNTVQTEEHFTNDRISRTLRNIKYSGFLLYKDTLYCDIVPKVVEPSVQAHVIEIWDKKISP